MALRYREWTHPNANLSHGEAEAWRIYCKHRAQKGLPPLCYGLYKVAAMTGRQANDIAFKSGLRRGVTPPNRKRPEWCSTTTWDSWMTYRRKYNDSVTLLDWIAGRFGVKAGNSRHNFATLQRSPAEIVAKIKRMVEK